MDVIKDRVIALYQTIEPGSVMLTELCDLLRQYGQTQHSFCLDIEPVAMGKEQQWRERSYRLAVSEHHGREAIEKACALYGKHTRALGQSHYFSLRKGGIIVIPAGRVGAKVAGLIARINQTKDDIKALIAQTFHTQHQRAKFVDETLGDDIRTLQVYRHIPLMTQPIRSCSFHWLNKDVSQRLSPEDFLEYWQADRVNQLSPMQQGIVTDLSQQIRQGNSPYPAYEYIKVQKAALTCLLSGQSKQTTRHVTMPIVLVKDDLDTALNVQTPSDYVPPSEGMSHRLDKECISISKQKGREDIGLRSFYGCRV